ncbi:hypothetical protein [Collimonas antrihumi]|uniref:hypothetical protein n=1 Tax=Collimonas antrihumi TaxID=1940615 RepID=UPI001B8BA82E|nr:hypothetical protein [Collimonas antrihumi]
MAKSLHAENLQRNIKIQKIDIGRDTGIIFASVSLLYTFIPQQKMFLGLFASMCWIVHWVIVCQQVNQLRVGDATGSIKSVAEIDHSSPNQTALE